MKQGKNHLHWYNAVDRHALGNRRNKAAYIWVAENGDEKIITYDGLYRRVNNFARALKNMGMKKISIYYTKGPQILLSDGSIVSGKLRKRLYGLEVC